MEQQKNNNKTIGALWLKRNKDGKVYFSGKVGEQSIIVFKNNFKKTENHPDYHVYASQSKPQEKDIVPSQAVRAASKLEVQNDDVPF